MKITKCDTYLTAKIVEHPRMKYAQKPKYLLAHFEEREREREMDRERDRNG